MVEDEQRLARALQRGLAAEGFVVDVAHDGPGGLELARHGDYDAMILDVMLPGLSGYRVVRQLRAEEHWLPVLMLSAKDGEYDQADGLELGADDYLVKPFSFVVLVAQLRALLRRGDGLTRLTAGELTVDRATRVVTWAGAPIDLSPREYALLAELSRRAGTVVSKDELLTAVWGDEQAATRNAVEVYVGYLRRKLDAVGAGHVLRTVRGHGYLVES